MSSDAARKQPLPFAAPRDGVVSLPIGSTDTALVTALRAGRRDAAEVLFDRYGKHVERVIARVLGPDPDVADLTQDVFVAALGSIDSLEDPAALKPWLTRMAVYTARGTIRRRTRWRFLRFMPFEDLPPVEAPAVSEEISEVLRSTYRVLERLGVDERIVFSLRFMEEMELTEVAAACGVSLATAKRRIARAKDRFVDEAQRYPALAERLDKGGRWIRK